MYEWINIWVPFMTLACVLFVFCGLQFQAQRIYSNKHKRSLNWINLWIFDLIGSSIFLCQGKLIMFSIIRVSGNSLQLLSEILPWAIMLLSAFLVSLSFSCSLFTFGLPGWPSHFYGKGMLRHAIKEVWRIFSLYCSLIFLSPQGLMMLFLFVIVPLKNTYLFLPFKHFAKTIHPERIAPACRKIY